jgi:hypothetical protein
LRLVFGLGVGGWKTVAAAGTGAALTLEADAASAGGGE